MSCTSLLLRIILKIICSHFSSLKIGCFTAQPLDIFVQSLSFVLTLKCLANSGTICKCLNNALQFKTQSTEISNKKQGTHDCPSKPPIQTCIPDTCWLLPFALTISQFWIPVPLNTWASTVLSVETFQKPCWNPLTVVLSWTHLGTSSKNFIKQLSNTIYPQQISLLSAFLNYIYLFTHSLILYRLVCIYSNCSTLPFKTPLAIIWHHACSQKEKENNCSSRYFLSASWSGDTFTFKDASS